MQSNNRAIIACAGSGKTTEIVRCCGAKDVRLAAAVTYTRKNHAEILQRFHDLHGRVLPNVRINTWFTFLLSELVRPYQRYLREPRISYITWVTGRSVPYMKKQFIDKYYFSPNGGIYSDKLSEFTLHCDSSCGGKVIRRLASIYSDIFIDEVQDLGGYDLDLLERFFLSEIRTTIVGDHRQITYKTNYSARNKQFSDERIVDWITQCAEKRLCRVEDRSVNLRGIQDICKLSDSIFPHIAQTTSGVNERSAHDGVFLVSRSDVQFYYQLYRPMVLRWDTRTQTGGLPAMNFGESKGLSFERVLIYPTGPIRKFLTTGDVTHIKDSRAKLYVAVTRAKFSVAFVFDGICKVPGVQRFTPSE